MKPPSHRRRPEPYFKVQYFDPVTLAWKDRQKEAFNMFEQALQFAKNAAKSSRTRVVAFKDGKPEVVHDQP